MPDETAALGPEVRGERLWRALERPFLLADRVITRALPERLNPLLYTGAIAMIALAVALVSGILLLFWYRPSLHLAWSSVAAMSGQPWGAGLVRSIHRYSSDLTMAVALVHALRLFFERRLTGPRWLAWVTGVAAVGALWLVGWTGYWLVWDTRAHAVAAGTARVLDVLPIFADPMGRSFLTDHSLNSLLFFVVFFAHMLVPLAMAVLLWLHLVRLARPRWIARGALAAAAIGAMIALSLARPADLEGQARMTQIRGAYAIDAWYLAPLALTDRLGGGALWGVALGAGALLFAMPWAMARRRASTATIYAARCTACEQCATDCPYDAIEMVPRTVGPAKFALQAEVNATKCVGCGICAASCDGFGTDLVDLSSVPEMRRAEGWVREAVAAGEAPTMLFACAHAAGAELAVDVVTGRCAELPEVRVVTAPCGGWVHTTTVERMLRVGAARVAIVACAPGACHYREGERALADRMGGDRHPHFRPEQAPPERVHVLHLDRTRRRELPGLLASLGSAPPDDASPAASGAPPPPVRRPSIARATAAAAVLAVVLMGGVSAASAWRYLSPTPRGSELVVTFKHPGRLSEHRRALSDEELQKIPVHMRRQHVYARERAPVRMRVTVDGRVVVDRAYPPKGLWKDGNSVAIETFPVRLGPHDVEAAIGDSHEVDEWTYRTRRTLEFTTAARRVIAFDRVSGFTVQ